MKSLKFHKKIHEMKHSNNEKIKTNQIQVPRGKFNQKYSLKKSRLFNMSCDK